MGDKKSPSPQMSENTRNTSPLREVEGLTAGNSGKTEGLSSQGIQVGKGLNESTDRNNSPQEKPTSQEKMQMFALKELEKAKAKMPAHIYEHHEGIIKQLLSKFGNDVSKLQDAVKKQVLEMQVELAESNPKLKHFLDVLRKKAPSSDFKKAAKKLDDLQTSELQLITRILEASPEKRAEFISAVKDSLDPVDFKNKNPLKKTATDELFDKVSTTKKGQVSETVSGLTKQEQIAKFKQEEEFKKIGLVLESRLGLVRNDLGKQLSRLQISIASKNPELFFNELTKIQPNIKSAVRELDGIITEGGSIKDSKIIQDAQTAKSGLNELLNLDKDTFVGLKASVHSFVSKEKQDNIVTELESRCASAIGRLRGEVVFMGRKTVDGKKQNEAQDAKTLESDLKYKGIDSVSSVSFAEYLTALHDSGRLNLSYLEGSISLPQLLRFGYLWSIDKVRKGKPETNAQAYLVKNKRPDVRQAFENVILEALDKEESKFKLDAAGKYENTRKILTTEVQLEPKMVDELIQKLRTSSNPLNDLVTILALTHKKIDTKEMERLVGVVSSHIAKDNGTLVSTRSEVLKHEIKGKLPEGSDWNKISDYIHKRDISVTNGLKWQNLMAEAKIASADRVIEKKDDWFFNSISNFHDIFASSTNIIEGQKILKKYQGKQILKPEYAAVLEQLLNILQGGIKQEDLVFLATNKKMQKATAATATEVKVQLEKRKDITEDQRVDEAAKLTNTVTEKNRLATLLEDTKAAKKLEEIPEQDYEKLVEILMQTDSTNNPTAKELQEICKNNNRSDFWGIVLKNTTYRLYMLQLMNTSGNATLAAKADAIAKRERHQLASMSTEQLKTYHEAYTDSSVSYRYELSYSSEYTSRNATPGSTVSMAQGNMQTVRGQTEERTSIPTLSYTSIGDSDSARQHMSDGGSISIGSSEVSQSKSGELIIRSQGSEKTIDRKYATAALATLEIATKLGFPEIIHSIDLLMSEMKYDPLFERIRDGASEYEEVLVAKRLAQAIGLNYNESAITPIELYNSIELQRSILPGSPSVQYIAFQNGILGNNGRVRINNLIERFKTPQTI